MDIHSNRESSSFEDFESAVTSNDLLLENILRHLSFEGLLNCSLINHRWLYYSRKELRTRRCLARVHSNGVRPCIKLIELSNLLEESPAESLPYNGLRIDYNNHESCVHYFSLATDGAFVRVMSKCPIKYLRVFLNEYTECPTMKFIKLLFNTRGSEIELLSLSNYHQYDFHQRLISFLGISDPSNWLSNLRILEMNSEMTEDILVEIVNAAPNLREIRGFIGLRHTPFLVAVDKVQLVTDFRLDPGSPVDTLDACLEFARRKPRLKSLYVTSRMHNEPWESQQWLEILALLMQGSAATLQKLEITHIDLLLLSSLDIPPMQELKEISHNYYTKLDRQLGCLSLQWIDYPKLFPSLDSVRIQSEVWQYGAHSFEGVPENLRRLLSKLSNRGVHSCRSARSLEVIVNGISPAWCDPLGAMTDLFPSITSIRLGKYRDSRPYVDLILRSAWPLKNITLECTQQVLWRKKLKLFNAKLCGVTSEELTHLSTFDSGSLQKVNLVPFGRSLLNFTGLKSLTIIVRCAGRSSPVEPMESAFISHVAKALMLSKLPGLNIATRSAP